MQPIDLLVVMATPATAFEAAGAPVFGHGLEEKYSAIASASSLTTFCAMGRHALVLPRALLEIAELQIEIACVLAPDDRDRLVFGQAFLPMADDADPSLVLDRLGVSGG